MKKLGYLISRTKLKNVADFIETTDDMGKFDTDLPAIIIGLESARAKIRNFSILRHKYDNDKFWTFGKTEKRTDFDRDVSKFYDYVLNKNINGLQYMYVDVLTFPKSRIKRFLAFLFSNDMKYAYIYKGMLYIYQQKYVFGLSLTLLEYCGIDTKKWITRISKNKAMKIYYNDAKLDAYVRQYTRNKRYLVPYFYFLIEEN